MTPRQIVSVAVPIIFGLLLVAWWVSPFAAVTLLVLGLVVAYRFRYRGPRLYPQEMRDEIVRRQGERCFYCNTPTHNEHDCPNGGDCPDCRQFDHSRSWKSGGKTTVRNGRVSCQFCNGRKGAGTTAELRAKVLDEWRAGRST